VRSFWFKEVKKNYQGEEGRKRIRMAAINLRDRDGLHLRLSDVVCPVLWLHVSLFSSSSSSSSSSLFFFAFEHFSVFREEN